MEENQRFFQMGGQWNAVHVPEKPNGFGVLIIGDANHFVDDHNSLWIQHIGRKRIIDEIVRAGYTVFYSNLYGVHWGSVKSVLLARQLYHIIQKQEILNDKIHVLAEGMGALTALQLSELLKEHIRSIALINPCIDLKAQMEQEKDRKFFFKKLQKELAAAYDISLDEIKGYDGFPTLQSLLTSLPAKIWQTTTNTSYDPNLHCKRYEELRQKNGIPIAVTYHLVEKRYAYGSSICQFFKKNEQHL
ncbi:pimeloyl-ACP methyl ester carboxylesterase [Bacillus tianshenii]|uniref:Pimeloyl-ACP methyl ester carboxylesterase n=1 Tax=Sutcliffiella tianshenii TaxID=1463404 RepID=A0ABS2P196_9BACI|nr:alpha/beta fold hydrolase [Bacillus tianshenii]MBM7620649.1 pimeloyl-ACP methyl ester carboxylesterase [Bacillus tianshenii]